VAGKQVASQAGRRPSGGKAGSIQAGRQAGWLASRQADSQTGSHSVKQAAEWWASRPAAGWLASR
jgi:hypothetical protein